MVTVTLELLIGWGAIALLAFIIGEYTDVFARAVGLGRAVPLGGPRTKRGLRLGGGLTAGLLAGPVLWSWAAGVLAGTTGTLALDAFGLSTNEILLVAVIALGVFIAVSRRERDDD